jgi:hypothetical protein
MSEKNDARAIPAQCKVCGKAFTSRTKLFKHLDVSCSEKEVLEEAQKCEKYFNYPRAIELYDKIDKPGEAARVRKLVAEQKKVDQTVIHGDYVDDRDTIVKDSVISKSNIGAGKDDKFSKLKELKEMFDSGFISKEEMEEMKKEILGK